MKSRPEALFLRYRKRGDAAALGELFDLVAPELLVIASHLARDIADADDLIGATFLAAIEGAQGYDQRRPLVPWLIGILVNQARVQRRRAARTPEASRLTEREVATPDRVAGEVELRAALERGLAQLASPYREVVSAHLIAGKAPQEIALDVERAPGTVRVQLHRGLDMLRKVLPEGFAAGAAMFAIPRGGLGVVREAVLEAARQHAAATVAGGGGAALAGKPILSAVQAAASKPAFALGALTVAALLSLAVIAALRGAPHPGAGGALAGEAAPRPASLATAGAALRGAHDAELDSMPAAPTQRVESRSQVAAAPPDVDTLEPLAELTPERFVLVLRINSTEIPRRDAHAPGALRVVLPKGPRTLEQPAGSARELTATALLNGSLELDMTAFVVDGEPPATVNVLFDHPGLAPWRGALELSFSSGVGRRVATTSIAVGAAYCVVKGKRGSFEEVVLVSASGDEPIVPLPLLDRSSARDAFELRVPCPGRFAVAWLSSQSVTSFVLFEAEEQHQGGELSVVAPKPPSYRTVAVEVLKREATRLLPKDLVVRLSAPEFQRLVEGGGALSEPGVDGDAPALMWVEVPRSHKNDRTFGALMEPGGKTTKVDGLALEYAWQQQTLNTTRPTGFAPFVGEGYYWSVEHPCARGRYSAPFFVARGGDSLMLQPLAFELEVLAKRGAEPAAGGVVLVEGTFGKDYASALPNGKAPEAGSVEALVFRREVTLDRQGRATLLAPAAADLTVSWVGQEANRVQVRGAPQGSETVRLSAAAAVK
ncbi:MAG: sigma-70 family RNA polymerase sigma factor [Planctomycetota bacterium]